MPIALADFRTEHFEPLLQRPFRFHRPEAPSEEPVELVLLEVSRFPNPERFPGRPPFTLLFELREGRPPSASLQRLTTEGFEECDLLVTRVVDPKRMRENPRGMFYEVVFA